MKSTTVPANLRSWIDYNLDTDFPIQNIPFGIGKPTGKSPRVVTIIGRKIVDILALYQLGHIKVDGLSEEVLDRDKLNDFIALGKPVTNATRMALVDLLSEANAQLKNSADVFTYDVNTVEMLLPVAIGDYTDFYSSREHATNVGTMFRDPNNALLPNWLHLPVGYHGRSSSIVVSGTPIKRPKGQTRPDPEKPPVFGPSQLMDFELEVGFVVGKDNALGTSVSTADAEDHIFGITLFNDWSARDIQKWEYVPLGPFLGKNFASTLSPWIVTLEALEPFRVESPEKDPEVLPYLKDGREKSFNIHLKAWIVPENGEPNEICHSNFKYMYWTMAQQLAHHTVNGCNLKVGDLCASGTISGPVPSSYGSMLELSWRGTKPLQLKDGSERKFLKDGDTLILTGHGQADGYRVGFGRCEGKLLPADE